MPLLRDARRSPRDTRHAGAPAERDVAGRGSAWSPAPEHLGSSDDCKSVA